MLLFFAWWWYSTEINHFRFINCHFIFSLIAVTVAFFSYIDIIQSTDIECSRKFDTSCVIVDTINTTNTDEIQIKSTQNAESIVRLELKAVSLTIELPTVIFTTFPSLQVLDYPNASVTILTNNTFENAQALHTLLLSNNQIQTVPANVFVTAKKLRTIHLDWNEIETIEDHAFDGLEHLSDINLNGNRIKLLQKFALIGATSLNTLHIQHNALETIEEGALDLPHLNEALFVANKLNILSDNLFGQIQTLKIVDFGHNQITHIGPALYNKTKELILDNNPIENINLTAIAEAENLCGLSLNSTGFELPEHWPEIESLTNHSSQLINLNLANNNLTTGNVLKHLSIFNNLITLNIDNNGITHLHDTYQIRDLFRNLTIISLLNNPICDWLPDNIDIFHRDEFTIQSNCDFI